jgi:tetratricopeptide (TPR) repeat protein
MLCELSVSWTVYDKSPGVAMTNNRNMPPLEPVSSTGNGELDDGVQAPTDAKGWFERGLRSARMGFPDKAAADFEEAAWLAPDNAEIQFNMGTAHLSMGMFEQALVNFDRAVDLKPDMADAIGNRAVALTALGQDERAERDIARAVELGAPPDGLAAVIEYVKTKRVPPGQ